MWSMKWRGFSSQINRRVSETQTYRLVGPSFGLRTMDVRVHNGCAGPVTCRFSAHLCGPCWKPPDFLVSKLGLQKTEPDAWRNHPFCRVPLYLKIQEHSDPAEKFGWQGNWSGGVCCFCSKVVNMKFALLRKPCSFKFYMRKWLLNSWKRDTNVNKKRSIWSSLSRDKIWSSLKPRRPWKNWRRTSWGNRRKVGKPWKQNGHFFFAEEEPGWVGSGVSKGCFFCGRCW